MIFSTSRAKRTLRGITFPVDGVTAASQPLPLNRLRTSLELRADCSILLMPEEEQATVIPPRLGSYVEIGDPPRADHMFVHPLIEAVHMAFSQHRPLSLSPDSIWLTIAQGFGHHIHEHAEELRAQLVRHTGRMTLTVQADALDASNWQRAIGEFSAQIREASDPVLHETLLCDFSTTTPFVRTASEVALMDTFERYFEYQMMCICGIPEVTLQGTPDDWRRMRARIEVLATFGLDWWVSRLRPVLDEFVRSADGKPDRDFWKAIYKPKAVYGGESATGWIADLFPYLRDAPERLRNPVFETPRTAWMVPVAKGIGPSAFPSGLSRAPVKLAFVDGSEGGVDLLAGFLGVGQNPEDNALYPIISWSVMKSLPQVERPPASERLARIEMSFTDIFAKNKKPEAGNSGA
jgi:hypothetical protein